MPRKRGADRPHVHSMTGDLRSSIYTVGTEGFDGMKSRLCMRLALALLSTVTCSLAAGAVTRERVQPFAAPKNAVVAASPDVMGATAHYARGQALQEAGRADEAIAEFQAAIRLNPEYV